MSGMQMKTSQSARDDQCKKIENRDLQYKELADRRSKIKGYSKEELEPCFPQRKLNALLLCDPVLTIWKLKLINIATGTSDCLIETANQLEAIRRNMKLLQEACAIAGVFGAQKLLECDHDQVTTQESHCSRNEFPSLDDLARLIKRSLRSKKDVRLDHHKTRRQI